MAALRAALASFFGSRLAIGLAGLLFVSFAAHSITAPDRLPPFGRVGLVELGIVPAPTLEVIQLPSIIPADIQSDLRAGVTSAATDAAPKAQARARAALAAHPEAIRWINYGMTALSAVLLAVTFGLQTLTIRRTRRDVYAFVDGGFGT